MVEFILIRHLIISVEFNQIRIWDLKFRNSNKFQRILSSFVIFKTVEGPPFLNFFVFKSRHTKFLFVFLGILIGYQLLALKLINLSDNEKKFFFTSFEVLNIIRQHRGLLLLSETHQLWNTDTLGNFGCDLRCTICVRKIKKLYLCEIMLQTFFS